MEPRPRPGCRGEAARGGGPWAEPGRGRPAGARPARRPLWPQCLCHPRWGVCVSGHGEALGCSGQTLLWPRGACEKQLASTWAQAPLALRRVVELSGGWSGGALHSAHRHPRARLGSLGARLLAAPGSCEVLSSCLAGGPRLAPVLVLTEGSRAAGPVSHPREGVTKTGHDSSPEAFTAGGPRERWLCPLMKPWPRGGRTAPGGCRLSFPLLPGATD